MGRVLWRVERLGEVVYSHRIYISTPIAWVIQLASGMASDT